MNVVPWSDVFDTLYRLSMLASCVFRLVHPQQDFLLPPLHPLLIHRVTWCEAQEAYSLGAADHSSSLQKEQKDR